MCHQKIFFVLLITIGSVVLEEVKNSDRSEFKKSLHKNCENSYSVTCLKLDVVNWVDKLNENGDISVFPGVALVKDNSSENTGEIVAELARNFPNDPDARLDAFLLKKVSGFLNTHSIKLNMWNADNAETARKSGGGGGGGGGGKKGGDGGMTAILAAAAMMKGMMFALALGGLAALAGKALMTGLISLLLSGIIGLKSLSGGGGHTTYEVVAKPVYTHAASHSVSHEEGHGGHGGWGRSLDVPLPLGLQPGYKPAQ